MLKDEKEKIRKKVGIVSPIGEVPPELTELYREDFDFVPANANVKSLSVKGYSDSLEVLPTVVDELVAEEVEGISIMGTSLTFFKGRKYNEQIEADLKEQTQLPVITMTTSVVQALNALGAKTVAIATPYSNEVTSLLIQTLKEYEIAVETTYNIETPMSEVPSMSTAEIVALGLNAVKDAKNADCLLISCGGLRTLPATSELESNIQLPVVSSAVAGAWATARMMGCMKRFVGKGKLLEVE